MEDLIIEIIFKLGYVHKSLISICCFLNVDTIIYIAKVFAGSQVCRGDQEVPNRKDHSRIW